MSERIASIFVFSIIFNTLFGMLAFTFTSFPTAGTTQLNIVIDQDKLLQAGIIFDNATSLNVTFGGAYQYFTYDRHYRVAWTQPKGFHFQKQNIIEEFTDTWVFPGTARIKPDDSEDLLSELWNSTIIEYWDPSYNWTKIIVDFNVPGFITTTPADDNNITKAVLETGTLYLTVGKVMETSTDINIKAVLNWYFNLIFGLQTYGLPGSLTWLLRLINILSIISGVFMLRELLKL